MGKIRSRTFQMITIVCLLAFAMHTVRLISPALKFSDMMFGSEEEDSISPLLSRDADMTEDEFLLMIYYMETYDWDNYDPNDFPDWMHLSSDINSSSGVVLYQEYDWDNYDPNDFPNWLDMPTTLPDNFTATDGDWIFEYMDEEFMTKLYEKMQNFSESDINSSSGFESILSGMGFADINLWHGAYALFWLVGAIISYVLRKG